MITGRNGPILFILTLMIASAIVTGCTPPKALSAKGTPIDLTINGSSLMKPVVKSLVQGFNLRYPSVKIAVDGVGSDTGSQYCSDGSIDIATISRELKMGEQRIFTVYKLARDGVAVIVHPSQTINGLRSEQVRDIYTGKITDWSSLGGHGGKIHVMATEIGDSALNNSARLDTPQSLILRGEALAEQAIECVADNWTAYENVRFKVGEDPAAIGLIPFGTLRNYVKALNINDVPPIALNVKSGNYPYVIPLYMVTRGPAGGLARDFIEYCLSKEGQQRVLSEGFLSIE